jgi:hypothetical protein
VRRASTWQPLSRDAKDEGNSHPDLTTRAANSQAPHFRSPATTGPMLGPNTTTPHDESLLKTSMTGRGKNPAYVAIAKSSGCACLPTSPHQDQNAHVARMLSIMYITLQSTMFRVVWTRAFVNELSLAKTCSSNTFNKFTLQLQTSWCRKAYRFPKRGLRQ